jgi:hypothetical protein
VRRGLEPPLDFMLSERVGGDAVFSGMEDNELRVLASADVFARCGFCGMPPDTRLGVAESRDCDL